MPDMTGWELVSEIRQTLENHANRHHQRLGRRNQPRNERTP
jgi:CheY-like chemotaxis protein